MSKGLIFWILMLLWLVLGLLSTFHFGEWIVWAGRGSILLLFMLFLLLGWHCFGAPVK